MIDRYGNKIIVAYSESEVLRIEAALTLAKFHRLRAYRDIALMTGRSVSSVIQKAQSLRRERLARVRDNTRKWIRSSELVTGRPRVLIPLEPSKIAPVSLAARMSGRASRSATTGMR